MEQSAFCLLWRRQGPPRAPRTPPQPYWGPGKGCAWRGAACGQGWWVGGVHGVGALLPLFPQDRWECGWGLVKVKPTHYLSLRATKVQVEHLGAVVRGHLQLLEGLLEQDGLAEPRLGGGDGEALVDVDGQGAILPLPRAGWGQGQG